MAISNLYTTPRAKTLLAIAVVLIWLLVRQQISQMDERFFQPSLFGAKGLVLYVLGDYSAAAEAYRFHVQEEYATGRTSGNAGFDALLRRDVQAAKQFSQKALAKNSDDIDALLNLGEIALDESEMPKALELLDRVLKKEVDQFDALILKAELYVVAEDYGKAIDSLKQALRRYRTESRITSFLRALRTTGILSHLPAERRPNCLIAYYYRYLRIYDDSNARIAISYSKEAIARGDRPDEAYLNMAVVFDKMHREDESLAAVLKAIELNPRNAEAYRRASFSYSQRGDLANELLMVRAAYETGGNDSFYFVGLRQFLIEKLGDYRQALTLALEVLKERPKEPDALHNVAYLYHLIGDKDSALQYYRAVLRQDNENTNANEGVAIVSAASGRQDEAIDAYLKTLSIEPSRSSAHIGLASIYAERRQFDRAIAEYEKVFSLDVNSLANLCDLYHRTSKFERAAICFKRVLSQDPRNPEAQQLLPYTLKNLHRDGGP